MKSWFVGRGYPEGLADHKFEKAKSIYYHFNVNKILKKGISLVVKYHPFLKTPSKIMSKNLYLFHMDEKVKNVFTQRPMISFRSLRKSHSYLVKAKCYLTEREFESFKCKKLQYLNHINFTETKTFPDTFTGET